MIGTTVNNKQLISLIDSSHISIKPFDQALLKTIHYPLTASNFLECTGRHGREPVFSSRANFKNDRRIKEAIFEPKEYLVAEITQSISLKEGIVGHFVPSSHLVDFGFSITCGRIEAPYGNQGEVIRFGITNNLSTQNSLERDEVLAYVYFVDLRALSSLMVDMTAEDEVLFRRWRKRQIYQQENGVHPLDE